MKKLLNHSLFISITFFIITMCVFGPLELYITNRNELWFSFYDTAKIALLMSTISGVILSVIGLLLRRKLRSLYTALLFVATLCLYIQGNYLNISYGLLDGNVVDWSSYTKYAIADTGFLLVLAGILLVIWRKKNTLFEKIQKYVSLFIIAIQLLTLGFLIFDHDILVPTEDTNHYLSTENMTAVGTDDNIFIFVLDTFDNAFMDQFMAEDGEKYRTMFADFTRFTDCAAGGATTAAAMPILITGESYPGQISYTDYVTQSFDSDGLYSELKKQGYNVNIYTEAHYIGESAKNYVSNFVSDDYEVGNYSGLAKKYTTFVLYKYVPHVLKQFFWLYTGDFNVYKSNASYTLNDAALYEAFSTDPLQLIDGNVMHIFHMEGSHAPYDMDEHAQPAEAVTREQQTKGALLIVEEYMQQLKDLGVYDNSMIIITSDHGSRNYYAHPILFVKDRNSTNSYRENNAPVSHNDLHHTLFEYLGKDTGDTFYEISETDPRTRTFYLRLQEGGSFYMKEFLIKDKLSVVGMGEETGNKLSPDTKASPAPFGERMTFALDGTANQYIISSIDTWPMGSVVTTGLETLLSFPFEETPTCDLVIDLEIVELYNETRGQYLKIYANDQLCYEGDVGYPRTLQFTVPAEALSKNTLELKLEHSHTLCPLYISSITISRTDIVPVVVEESSFSITEIIGIPLAALLNICQNALNNYALAIILFTLLTKVILFPISMWTQKNGITMVRLTPELNRLKIKYYGDKDAIADGTQELYKRENYHALASTVPMIIQLVMLMGVIGAVKTVMGDADTILNITPSQMGGWTYIMPVAAGLAALALGLAQNVLNPLQREQSKKEQWMTNGVSIGISLVLGAFVSMGVCIYWIASNIFSILQQMVLNIVVNPKKYIDYEELEKSKKELAAMDSLSAGVSKEDKQREKEDYKRFFSIANKHLVIYSEKSGFYKYFKDVMDYLLVRCNVIIHYVTSDPKDQIFEIAKTQPRIQPYYIGESRLITLMMKMDADVVVMTVPDLENFHLKRSYVRKDIEYIYMFHYPLSTHMVLRTGALDHYDTIFCVGDFQFDEIRAAERVYGLPEKKLISAGYGQLEQLHKSYQAMKIEPRQRPKILLAPSWQPDNILDSCVDEVLGQLLDKGYEVVVRPHPEYMKRFGPRMDQIVERFKDRIGDELKFELDFTSNNSLFDSDILITDWSGSAYEFSFVTLKPSVFIDTTPKINNPEYIKLGVEPLEFGLRSQVGIQVSPDALDGLDIKINELLANGQQYADKILEIREKYIANFGRSGIVGGQYIIDQLIARQNQKKSENK